MKQLLWILAVLLLGTTLAGCRGQGGSAATADAADTPVTTDYTGIYYDEDGTDNTLDITPDSTAGDYRVTIGIFRLASFDDGLAQTADTCLTFTATDPAGQPIGGTITLKGDTAVVTFTDSQWDYIPNGTQFRYHRNPAPESGETAYCPVGKLLPVGKLSYYPV